MLTGLTYDIDISTHTPHARRDVLARREVARIEKFQLTRLMRGVTFWNVSKPILFRISTHTPHARRDRMGLRIPTGIR